MSTRHCGRTHSIEENKKQRFLNGILPHFVVFLLYNSVVDLCRKADQRCLSKREERRVGVWRSHPDCILRRSQARRHWFCLLATY